MIKLDRGNTSGLLGMPEVMGLKAEQQEYCLRYAPARSCVWQLSGINVLFG